MGCNESKHDVVAGATVSNRPLLRRKSTRKNKEVLTPADSSTNGKIVGDVKDISAINTELKEGEVGEDGKSEPGKSVLSPDQYFSSRKDEDAAESVATEEGYFSPPHEHVKDIESGGEEEVVEESGGIEKVGDHVKESGVKVDDEVKEKKGIKGRPKESNEANLAKQDVASNAEEVPTTTTEEHNPLVVPQEKSSGSSTKEPQDQLKQ